MSFRSKNGFSYAKERSKHIWTTKDLMWVGIIGFLYGMLIKWLIGI